MPDLPYKLRGSDRDVPEAQMDCCVTNRRWTEGLGDFPVSVIFNGFKFCGRKRVVLESDQEHVFSVLSMAVCQARTEETLLWKLPQYSSASMGATEVANRLVDKSGRHEQVLKIEMIITDPIVSWVVEA